MASSHLFVRIDDPINRDNVFYLDCNSWPATALWVQRYMGFRSGKCSRQFTSDEPPRFRKVTHCLFDLDGTITDSEKSYHQMIRKICEQYGAKYDAELQKEVYGASDRDTCIKVVERLKLPMTPDELRARLKEMGKLYLPASPLQKGANRLLYHLHKKKVPMALVTNSTQESVDLHVTVRPKLFSLFHHMVCANDPEVTKVKPDPEPFLIAAKRFPENPKPEKCLVFEDSVIGVTAALAAGMQVVMIPYIRTDRRVTVKPTFVIHSLLDFKPEYFGLPAFEDHNNI